MSFYLVGCIEVKIYLNCIMLINEDCCLIVYRVNGFFFICRYLGLLVLNVFKIIRYYDRDVLYLYSDIVFYNMMI